VLHVRQGRDCDRLDYDKCHLSFVETGRSTPSRDMVLHLAERLEIPLRERNKLLIAAGYAPVYPERKLDDPALDAARKAVDLVLAGHEPIPRSPSIATGRSSPRIAPSDRS